VSVFLGPLAAYSGHFPALLLEDSLSSLEGTGQANPAPLPVVQEPNTIRFCGLKVIHIFCLKAKSSIEKPSEHFARKKL
jgi:hypothetical protein